ncbi:uncharacterized protein BXZ73DRAFT_92291 [Epithele typhae]|uniref:uncharacterized protein n=1 Tax=Epithele typhae TaxID=378194 RepID=UPI00200889B7|nr:uncharacterized protein BXZ73DRAFT_92291 [Epithele typhae]KAH9918242.1 hypothetical protein BXZ73DRAFT_92291 [Epithele typhae]
MDDGSPPANSTTKVVVVSSLTRNVLEPHLQTIFGFYGDILKMSVPLYVKSGQNKGKATIEFADSAAARKAVSHMDGGQIDGAAVKVELSDGPFRSHSRSRSPRRHRLPWSLEELLGGIEPVAHAFSQPPLSYAFAHSLVLLFFWLLAQQDPFPLC